MKCIDCDAEMEIEEKVLEVGAIVICAACGVELEVLRKSPCTLGKVMEVEDDDGE